jgi:hypothetical protein
MEKKIGILTFHFPDNYGAVLQTYSLLRKINSLGYDAEVIDYVPGGNAGKNKVFVGLTGLKSLASNMLRLLTLPFCLIRRNRFRAFRSNFIRTSERYSAPDDIPYERYGTVVTGSDQTFNRNYDFTDVYYQPFVKSEGQTKVAYAPSLGSMSPALLDDASLDILKDFDHLSCREQDAADALSEMLNREVSCVLDPVFLTDREEWLKLTGKPCRRKPYVFVYDLNAKDKVVKIARQRYPHHDILIYSNDPLGPVKMRGQGIHFTQSAGVEDFLTLICHSDAVVTDSFHGTAFSLIMEKDFYVYLSLEKAADRIISLLQYMGLEDRITCPGKDVKSSQPDYSVVRKRLGELIARSESFLKEALDER